ncbi:MAG TPA: hypothetical protein VNN10_07880 [Dehalococcoidia bacterium]|nr:hypothetical protein [Dehalococcoidia bacterium]
MQLLVLQREEAPEDLAAEIYDSLNWSNDVPGVMSALRRAHPDRYNVQSAFEAEHGSIWSYLKDQLSIEQVIDAYAYFLHGHKHDLHVALARAILPSGTRDAEIHRILASVPVANRPALAEQYEADYWDLGEGTLRADLINDQSGWELEKSLSLLDHATTEAEQLYFDSVAITGTNTDAVIGRLQRIAASDDPNAFARLEEEWDRFVKTDEGWNVSRPSDLFEDAAGVDLRTAIESELSGEDAGFALAAIDNGRLRSESAAGAAPTGTEGAAGTAALTPEQVFADEELRLQMHMAYLRAAAEGALPAGEARPGEAGPVDSRAPLHPSRR